MEIRELKRSAKASLKGNWGLAIGAYLVSVIISAVVSTPTAMADPDTAWYSFLTLCINLFIAVPLQAGISWFYLDIYDKRNPEIIEIFSGFKRYWKVVGASVMMGLFIFLWFLLLIVPGIIKAISYSQTLFLIKENPDMGVFEAIKESRRMMKGYKWKYFLTMLSFIGWVLVPIICFLIAIRLLIIGFIGTNPELVIGSSVNIAIGMLLVLLGFIYMLGISFYLMPYYSTTIAGFYRKLVSKSNNQEEATVSY